MVTRQAWRTRRSRLDRRAADSERVEDETFDEGAHIVDRAAGGSARGSDHRADQWTGRFIFFREKRKKKRRKILFFQNFANLFLTNFSDGHDGHNLDNAAYSNMRENVGFLSEPPNRPTLSLDYS